MAARPGRLPLKLLVTGAAGFIGRYLVDRLAASDPSLSFEERIGRLAAWFREHEERLT